MRIKNLQFDVPIFLAPMAGVTDLPYCILAREMGASMIFSEMISATGIHFQSEKTLAMLETHEKERPLALQLFGNNPKILAEVAKWLDEQNICDAIDLNMGCPAPKITGNGAGSSLLKPENLKLAEEILKAMRQSISNCAFTVKMRLGWDENNLTALDLTKCAEEIGVDAVTIHGRTRNEFYSGHAHWDEIAKIKEAVQIPIIANGDVRTVDDLERILKITKCDGVMIGRAAQGNPWIFREMKEFYLAKKAGKMYQPEKILMSERATMLLRHLDMLIEFKGNFIATREMRKHATWYTRGLYGGKFLREKFNQANTREDFVKIVEAMMMENEKTSEKI